MARPDRRLASLVLCLPDGTVLGETAPFEVPSRHRIELQALTAAAGVDGLRVLRLVGWERHEEALDVTRYLAEVDAAPSVPLRHIGTVPDLSQLTADHPLRVWWARPGGQARLLDWGRRALADANLRLVGEPQQVRSWCLSGIWKLPTDAGPVWLKAVPPWFAHEGLVVELLQGRGVPGLIARGDGVALLADAPGEEGVGYQPGPYRAAIDAIIGIHRQWLGRTDELLALGLPDWRPAALAAPAARVLDVVADELGRERAAAFERLLSGLDARAAALAGCGLPDTLVHGDFHPGNTLADGDRVTILDWGDSGIGHPLLDELCFTQWGDDVPREELRAYWARAWQAAVPGCDPSRAAELLRPVSWLHQAVIYQGFLDRTEPDEHLYFGRAVLASAESAADLA